MRLARHLAVVEIGRPKTRGECVDGPRPCPWYGCRHHLGNDEHNGSVRVREIEDGEESCSLDVADRGDERTVLDIATLTGVWHSDAERALCGAVERLRGKMEE